MSEQCCKKHDQTVRYEVGCRECDADLHVSILQEEIESLSSQLSAAQVELGRVRPVFDLAIQFYLSGDSSKLIDYITENVDIEKSIGEPAGGCDG